MQRALVLAQRLAQPLPTIWTRSDSEAGPFLLVTMMPSHQTGPAPGVRAQLPRTSMARALSVRRGVWLIAATECND